jgi:hypothetical protein
MKPTMMMIDSGRRLLFFLSLSFCSVYKIYIWCKSQNGINNIQLNKIVRLLRSSFLFILWPIWRILYSSVKRRVFVFMVKYIIRIRKKAPIHASLVLYSIQKVVCDIFAFIRCLNDSIYRSKKRKEVYCIYIGINSNVHLVFFPWTSGYLLCLFFFCKKKSIHL